MIELIKFLIETIYFIKSTHKIRKRNTNIIILTFNDSGELKRITLTG